MSAPDRKAMVDPGKDDLSAEIQIETLPDFDAVLGRIFRSKVRAGGAPDRTAAGPHSATALPSESTIRPANRLGASAPTANARSRRLAASLSCTIWQSSGSRMASCWPG